MVYGCDPPSIHSYEPGETRVAAVARDMEDCDAFLADVRHRLEQAQAVQKRHYDKHHRHVSYAIGDWVLLRLHQRAALSLPQATSGKLKARFVGPYRVIELVNAVAVRLALPSQARLHDVFHVSMLKKFIGTPPSSPPPLSDIKHSAVIPAPERVTQTRLARGVYQVLVHWRGESASVAS